MTTIFVCGNSYFVSLLRREDQAIKVRANKSVQIAARRLFKWKMHIYCKNISPY